MKKNAFEWLAISLGIAASLGCAGKDDTSGDAPDEEGLRLCCELGALCHVTDDNSDAEVADCHQLGHQNVPEDCRREYDRCAAACIAANGEPGGHDCE